MPSRQIPTALYVVAILFIVGGVASAIEVINSLLHDHVNINIGVLGLFIGPGLLRLNRGWRTCALVFIWIGLIMVPVVSLVFLLHDGQVEFNLFGQQVGHVSSLFALLMLAAFFAFMLWEYRVLTRSDVRFLFGVSNV
jgi:hypothetical protein